MTNMLGARVKDTDRPLTADMLPPNMLVPYYLMASYLYYKEDVSLFPDSEYDRVCQRLDVEWDNVQHFHKFLVDRDSLSATTGYAIKAYPLRVINAALALAKQRGLSIP